MSYFNRNEAEYKKNSKALLDTLPFVQLPSAETITFLDKASNNPALAAGFYGDDKNVKDLIVKTGALHKSCYEILNEDTELSRGLRQKYGDTAESVTKFHDDMVEPLNSYRKEQISTALLDRILQPALKNKAGSYWT